MSYQCFVIPNKLLLKGCHLMKISLINSEPGGSLAPPFSPPIGNDMIKKIKIQSRYYNPELNSMYVSGRA